MKIYRWAWVTFALITIAVKAAPRRPDPATEIIAKANEIAKVCKNAQND